MLHLKKYLIHLFLFYSSVIFYSPLCHAQHDIKPPTIFSELKELSDKNSWRHEEGECKIITESGKCILQVTGTAEESTSWKVPDYPFSNLRKASGAQGLARIIFYACSDQPENSIISGTDFSNQDVQVTDQWKEYSRIIHIPENIGNASLRFGQWHKKGIFKFRDIHVYPVVATYAENGLSAEEEYCADENYYLFSSNWEEDTGGYSRMLVNVTANYNTNRWCMRNDQVLTYRFNASDVPGKDNSFSQMNPPAFHNGKLEFTVGYYTHGKIYVEISPDGHSWSVLTSADKVGTFHADLPAETSAQWWVRFRADKKTSLQLYGLRFHGWTKPSHSPDTARATNRPKEKLIRGSTTYWTVLSGNTPVPPEQLRIKEIKLPEKPGAQVLTQSIKWGGKTALVQTTLNLNPFYRTDYGEMLPGAVPLWWCSASHKIPRQRSLPVKNGMCIKLSSAGNDYESAQIILRPKKNLNLLQVKISDLKSATGKTIPASNMELRDVYYHYVEYPTDRTCVCDFHPDALPPLVFPKPVKAGENQPLWLTIYTPSGTAPGDYTGSIKLTVADHEGKKTLTIPIQLHIWGFSLPVQNHLQTAFGLRIKEAFRYHGIKSDQDKRVLLDKYFTIMSTHRISPFNPVPLDPFTVTFIPNTNKPEKSYAKLDFSKFDAAFSGAIKKYHFTGYNLPIQGMGGGSYHERWEPKILKYTEHTPEFQSMFASQVKQLEAHLRQRGWLDMAYIYWFDEPAKKDYSFVRNGMSRIKRYAPSLHTMLTEEPAENESEKSELGPVKIWCPVTCRYHQDYADPCRARGDIFWWYVCCSPKAPYCTEFTDHPAVELRTWLWQTWKYHIQGILIWESIYWTSEAAYPDKPQNPYLDPMSYVSAYSTPPGTRKFWGNGDGRFIYPPLSCAVPSKKPCLDAPVPSIRLVMLREGIEDYEMLYKLRSLLAEKKLSDTERSQYNSLLNVPEDITRSMTDFCLLPDPIYTHRKCVAEAIEQLMKKQP